MQDLYGNELTKGDDVIIVSGRKIPINSKGRLFWIGIKPWGASVGIELLNGNKEFTALKNIRKCNGADDIKEPIDYAEEVIYKEHDEKKNTSDGWGF